MPCEASESRRSSGTRSAPYEDAQSRCWGQRALLDTPWGRAPLSTAGSSRPTPPRGSRSHLALTAALKGEHAAAGSPKLDPAAGDGLFQGALMLCWKVFLAGKKKEGNAVRSSRRNSLVPYQCCSTAQSTVWAAERQHPARHCPDPAPGHVHSGANGKPQAEGDAELCFLLCVESGTHKHSKLPL